MGCSKNIFKIIILVQLLACALATYGHPDAEFIDFRSPTQPSRDQMIIEAAAKRGMDVEAVTELLHTRKPVVRTTTTPGGFTKTTTYKLEPDGSISSKTILQTRTRHVYNSGSIPDELKKSPTGTVTRTFTDSDGNKVTQTIAVSRDKMAPAATDTGDLKGDWFSKHFGSWPEDAGASTQFSTSHRTMTAASPSGGRPTGQSWWSQGNNTPKFQSTSTRTFIKPNGEKHVIQTTSNNPDHTSKFPPIGDINWPSFEDPAYSPSWDAMGSADNDDEEGWELFEGPEVTTKKNTKNWTPKTWEWPEFPTHPTTPTPTSTTTIPSVTTRRSIPSLDDFLKSQYGTTSHTEPTTSTSKSYTYTPKYETTTTPKSSTTTPKFIKIEDLPVTEVLINGKPADKTFLETLPAHLTPRTPNETVLSIEHKHPIEEDTDSYTPKMETSIRSYSKTHIGPEKPRLKDLDPQMQDILNNAGIVPEIEGDTVTKTRTEPDGRVITTTYKVNTVSSTPLAYTPTQHHYIPSQFPSYQRNVPLQPLQPHLSPIAEFLARLGLNKFDLTSRNGRYSKTIIDDNGDILTANFVLTSPSKQGSGRK